MTLKVFEEMFEGSSSFFEDSPVKMTEVYLSFEKEYYCIQEKNI